MKGKIEFNFLTEDNHGPYSIGMVFDTDEINLFEARVKAILFSGIRSMEIAEGQKCEEDHNLREMDFNEYRLRMDRIRISHTSELPFQGKK